MNGGSDDMWLTICISGVCVCVHVFVCVCACMHVCVFVSVCVYTHIWPSQLSTGLSLVTVADRFYIALFSALELTHCTHL